MQPGEAGAQRWQPGCQASSLHTGFALPSGLP